MLFARLIFFSALAFGFASFAYSQPTTIGVVVETAELTLNEQQVEALGTAKANEAVDITVSVAERVKQVHFDSGQRVAAGAVLLELENREEKALLAEIQHTLDESRQQLQRIRALAKRGDASQSLLDEKQREYNVANARLTAIQSQLDERIIKAPFAGILGLRNISAGAYVAPGEVVTTLIDDSQIKVDFQIPSLLLQYAEPQSTISATTKSLGGRQFSGIIHSRDNQIDPITRSITVRALIPNPDHMLTPGLLMEVKLSGAKTKILTVNEAALIQQGRQAFVYTVAKIENKLIAKKVEVVTGIRTEGKIEMVQGLNAGDQVVVHGNIKLQDQSPIKLLASPTDTDTL